MLTRIRKRVEEKDEGFTLIELLVVIIIIGILAAIAIPTFLNQRQKGWDAAARSALKNAATAQESHFTDNNTYATAVTGAGSLQTQGFNPGATITFTIVRATASVYCMRAVHTSNTANVWMMTNDAAQTVPQGQPYLVNATNVACT